MKEDASHLNHGHRQRLRDRLLRGGASVLEPDELLELILFLSIPRGDVKPLAKTLWKRYGSFQALTDRPQEELRQIKGLGDQSIAVLKTIYALAEFLTRPYESQRPLVNSMDQLLRYARLRMTPFDREHCLVFYLNKKQQVIHEEIHQKGTQGHVSVYPRELIKNALNTSAASLILMHNHPEGFSEPSEEDKTLTTTLQKMCQALELELTDHIILTSTDFFSFSEEGLL